MTDDDGVLTTARQAWVLAVVLAAIYLMLAVFTWWVGRDSGGSGS